MLWLIIAIVIIWIAAVSPAFRKVLIAIVLIALIGIAALLLWLNAEKQNRLREETAARQRIPRANIDLVDLRMGLNGPSTTLHARVRNNDQQYTLSGVELRLRVLDCRTPDACDIVGETVEQVGMAVPPNQVRDIEKYVYFRDLGSTRPNRRWTFDVVSVSGRSQ